MLGIFRRLINPELPPLQLSEDEARIVEICETLGLPAPAVGDCKDLFLYKIRIVMETMENLINEEVDK